METKFKISGFKCFNGEEFEINQITLLTGSNGTGKSSFIQALLLARLSLEKNLIRKCEDDYKDISNWNNHLVSINNGYQLKLGTIYDVINEKNNAENIISILLGEESFKFSIPKDEDNTMLDVEFSSSNQGDVPFWRRKEFYYLHTERLGPRYSLESTPMDYIHCGYQGEYTAQVLVNYGEKVDFSSAMIESKSSLLKAKVNEWLDQVCPGVTISAVPTSSMTNQIKVSGSSNKSEMLATNIGFGISYVLPIIVTGLIAQKDSVFIVENPEAHLHPKGQSNIGFFLGKVAMSGIRIIIETHSEHVVNGIRRATLADGKSDLTNVYFFSGFNSDKKLSHEKIKIESNGNLTNSPIDFFDQSRQDLLEVLKITNR